MKHRPSVNIVGSGVNGLVAAARLATSGWEVNLYERNMHPGGAAVSSTDIFPGNLVDMGAAAHPFGIASPAFNALGLDKNGLEWLMPPIQMAHPLEEEEAALLSNSLDHTAVSLGRDFNRWKTLHSPIVENIDEHLSNIWGPLSRFPKHPFRLTQFAPRAVLPATVLATSVFSTERARALFVGSSAHAVTSPRRPFTSAFGVLFNSLGMSKGWPVAQGGTQSIVDALVHIVRLHGGYFHTGCVISSINELPFSDAIILNLTPRQVLNLKDISLRDSVRRQLQNWKYGTACFKVDFLLKAPVPWSDPRVGQAGTVHVCGTADEIAFAESEVESGRLPDRPFVMVSQQYVADHSRGLTLWTYAHVPHGYIERFPGEVRQSIIRQIERFAPNFSHVIDSFHEASPGDLEHWNPNLVGGDTAGGSMAGIQAFMRPRFTARPYRLGQRLYVASSSTPPGAGVHGMSGWWAAGAILSAYSRNR